MMLEKLYGVAQYRVGILIALIIIVVAFGLAAFQFEVGGETVTAVFGVSLALTILWGSFVGISYSPKLKNVFKIGNSEDTTPNLFKDKKLEEDSMSEINEFLVDDSSNIEKTPISVVGTGSSDNPF